MHYVAIGLKGGRGREGRRGRERDKRRGGSRLRK